MGLTGFIQSLLHNNQFAAGGIATVLLGAFLAFAKGVPKKLWDFALSQTTVYVIITDNTEGFYWFKRWFSKQERARKLRKNDLHTFWEEDKQNFDFTPAPGVHWMWNHGYPLSIEFIRKENNGGTGGDESKRTEDFKITAFGRNPTKLRELVQKMKDTSSGKDQGKLIVRTITGRGDVNRYDNFLARTLDSVILPEGVKENLVEDIDKFLHSRSWYQATGIPYHRGYLFHGLPGTGKTSISIALAERFKLPVYILNLNSLSDEGLLEGLRNRGCPVMFVFEDIDCAVNKRTEIAGHEDEDKPGDDKASPFGVSLSGLLNAMDGILAPSGAVFFMTTNCVEKLDPALLRPGRCDMKVEFGVITAYQKEHMLKKFFPEIADEEKRRILDADTSVTPADFQGMLLRLRGQNQIVTDAEVKKQKGGPIADMGGMGRAWVAKPNPYL